MFGVLCKKLVHNVKLMGNPTQNQFGFLQTISSPIKSFSSSSLFAINDEQQLAFTITYLINSCGLPLENAVTVSKKVHFETPDKPDSVLRLLRNHGFTNAQIAKVLRSRPEFLLANPEKILFPKLEFFNSIVGLSATELSTVISLNPNILAASLVKNIIPSYEFIKSIVNADEKVATAVKRCPWLFARDVQKRVALNIAVLRDHGVPQASYITLLLSHRDGALVQNCDKFEKCVKEVIKMGFKPSKMVFVTALQVLVLITEATRNRKVEVYRQWGWSETEFRAAFRSNPVIMTLSEMKITNAMEFFVNKMGMESADIARNPTILTLSLEKRIIPRCSVTKILLLKGLIKDLSVRTYLLPTEKHFLDKFVTKYEEDAPELMSVYQGKMRIYGLNKL